MLFRGVADAADRRNEDPIAAVDAVLSAVDVTVCIVRGKLDDFASKRNYLTIWLSAVVRLHRHGFEVFYYRRCVVDFEALAFALGAQCVLRWIGRRVASHDFQIISAVRQGSR